MSEQRSPARPWFDVVIEQSAIRGWGIAELARRAHVGRPTIYGWRDGAEGKIQAGPVNAVADALGIPRERALRLAGIIGERAAPEPPQDPDLPSPAELDDLRARIREVLGDEKGSVLEAAMDAALADKTRRGTGASSAQSDAGRRRPRAS